MTSLPTNTRVKLAAESLLEGSPAFPMQTTARQLSSVPWLLFSHWSSASSSTQTVKLS